MKKFFKKTKYTKLTDEQTKKLTNEECIDLILKTRAGDKGALEELYNLCHRLIRQIAKRYYAQGLEIDDFVSKGYDGFYKAVCKYEVNSNIKFTTYVCTCAQNEILKLLHKQRKYSSLDYLETPTSVDSEGNTLTLADTTPDDSFDINHYLEQQSELTNIKNIVATFSERDQRVFNSLYGITDGEPKSAKEVAIEEKLSRSNISRQNTLIIKKIKRARELQEIRCANPEEEYFIANLKTTRIAILPRKTILLNDYDDKKPNHLDNQKEK